MSTLLVLKLLLAPTLIAAVSLAGRRWGPEVSGWLAGLPITGGPILLVIALEQGRAYAAATAVAALVGTGAFVAFCLAFAWSGRRAPWWLALPIGYAAYFLVGWPLTQIHLGAWLATGLSAAALALGAMLLPRAASAAAAGARPWWELPARMIATALVVVSVSALATWLGPGWIGVLTVFPTAATVLGGFTMRHDGPGSAARVLRGLHLGMLGGLPGFFAIIAVSVLPLGIGGSFALGLGAACLGQAVLLVALRLVRPAQPAPPTASRHSQAASNSSTV